ncbi:hypothetical protein P8625_11840 [Tenacibaculum tangerinum]|uniref:Uncharacterized protein n=1 Tax=Tenacibaculum tangerinum TaxID=3038772 RepID=A0ABY8KZY5_9FLAO|nr:hypothetical protein [Tenacibaculum tangerinum]WGH74769.1 hypothetical protein P8625_11840 [Tenacibaculum tangerinum]
MAETKIDYKGGKGFWIAEIYMELTYEYILQALEDSEEIIPFKDDLKEDINFFVNAYGKGMLTLLWFNFIKTDEDEKIMICLLNRAKKILESKGDYIEVDELNGYEEKKEEMASKWPKPIKTTEIIKIIDTLILMLKGEWEETSYSMEIEYSFID